MPTIHQTRFLPRNFSSTGTLPTCRGLVSNTANYLNTPRRRHQVHNKLASRCIWETTQHNRYNGVLPRQLTTTGSSFIGNIYKDSHWLHFKHIYHSSIRALYLYWLPHLLIILVWISTIVHTVAFVNLILKKMVVVVRTCYGETDAMAFGLQRPVSDRLSCRCQSDRTRTQLLLLLLLMLTTAEFHHR